MRTRRRAQVILASAEDFPESLGRFDLILSYMNLHLWAEPARGLKRLQSALTENGMAYLVDVRRDISARLREDGLNYFPPHANFRAVFFAQIKAGLTMEEVTSRLAEITRNRR